MRAFDKPILILGKSCDQTLAELADARRDYFERADLILAPGRTMDDMPPEFAAKSRRLDARPEKFRDALLQRVERGEKVLILANGDPMFYGIGSTLATLIPPEYFQTLPAPGCLQTLAARIGWPDGDFASLSLHGRPDFRPLKNALKTNRPICVLLDAKNGPDLVARYLLDRGADNCECVVGENLGEESEKISRMDLATCGDSFFSPNSVAFFGPLKISDAKNNSWAGGRRAKPPIVGAAIEALALDPSHVLWDVGSGSGAAAIMAAKLAGEIFAIEKEPARAMDIQLNRARERAANVDVVLGEAPAAARDLPRPQRIFLGGGLSAKNGDALLNFCLDAIPAGGRIAASCVLLESFNKIARLAKSSNLALTARQIFSSVLSPLGEGVYFKPENPTYLVLIEKK